MLFLGDIGFGIGFEEFFGDAYGDALEAACGLKGLMGASFSVSSSKSSKTDILILPASAVCLLSSTGLGVRSLAAKVNFLRRLTAWAVADTAEVVFDADVFAGAAIGFYLGDKGCKGLGTSMTC